jgi:hypothetical protein
MRADLILASLPVQNAGNRAMLPRDPPKPNETSRRGAEYRELLGEFIRMFEAMPQKYCLFCEATSSLGPEAHKPDCAYRRATNLLSERGPTP